MRHLYFPVAVLLLLCAACGPAEEPVSKEEALQLAKSIQGTIARGNPALINDILDVRSFAARIEKNTGTKISAASRAEIGKSLERRKLGTEIVKSMGNDGTYKLLRQYDQDGRQHLLFRLYGESGINYHDFELVKRQRQVKAADLFIYYTGEPISTTIGNLMADMTGKLKDKEAAASLADMRRIQQLSAAGKNEDAEAVYNALPEVVKHQRMFMLVHISICAGISQEQYLAAIEAFKQYFPHEKNIPLLMIDGYFMNGDYVKALQAVNDLDKLVGTDPFLNYYRGLMYKQLGDTAGYRSSIEQLYAYDPEFQDGAVELIAIYLDHKAYDKARTAIAAFRTHAGWKQQVMNRVILKRDHLPADIAREAGGEGS